MKVILICTKKEFDQKRIRQIEKHAPVKWIDDEKVNLLEVTDLFDNEEKILALSPVSLSWKIPKDIYKKLRNVRHICLVTTAYDFIDLDQCKALGIQVTNVPYYSTNAVAEYAVYMMMSLLKKFPIQFKSDFKYEFTDEVLMEELKSKTVGIVGLGHIGSRTAEITTGLGMKTYYWSRNKKKTEIPYKNLEELIETSDIVFPTIAVNEETANFFNKDLLSKLKPTSYFISMIDEKAWDKQYLLDRASENKLAGLAFESDKKKMIDFNGNVFVTARLAWYTDQSLENNIQIWVDNIISVIEGNPKNVVN